MNFRPSRGAQDALGEILALWPDLGGFRDGPCGLNELDPVESALFAATYEVRRALGQTSDEVGEHLARVYEVLTDGVLRSLVLARGGVDWVEHADD